MSVPTAQLRVLSHGMCDQSQQTGLFYRCYLDIFLDILLPNVVNLGFCLLKSTVCTNVAVVVDGIAE